MAIQRWDPARDVRELQQQVNRMFEDVLSRSAIHDGPEPLSASPWRPPIDLFEEPSRYVLRADIPGVLPTDVEVKVEGGRLLLRGERKLEGSVDREAYLRIERPSGRFSAQLALPPSVDRARIQANHRNGVLEVVLPKKAEELSNRVEIADA
jgi:HSP20 family protein